MEFCARSGSGGEASNNDRGDSLPEVSSCAIEDLGEQHLTIRAAARGDAAHACIRGWRSRSRAFAARVSQLGRAAAILNAPIARWWRQPHETVVYALWAGGTTRRGRSAEDRARQAPEGPDHRPAQRSARILCHLTLAHDIAKVAPTSRGLRDAVRHAFVARPFSGEVVTIHSSPRRERSVPKNACGAWRRHPMAASSSLRQLRQRVRSPQLARQGAHRRGGDGCRTAC